MDSSMDGSISSSPDVECWSSEDVYELKQHLRFTSMKLESAKEEARSQEEMYTAKLNYLEELLKTAQRERDEAHQHPKHTQTTTWEDTTEDYNLYFQDSPFQNISVSTHTTAIDLTHSSSSSELDDSDVSMNTSCLSGFKCEFSDMFRCLPEKGQLLQAVMQAGPLLHTLMLAGPLPQWHCPPPVVDSFQIPHPVLRCSSFGSCL